MMKKDKLLKLMNISPAQMREITGTIAEAEKKTTGEIALAVVYQSDSYAFVELFIAFCAAFTDILGIHRPNSATKIKGGNTVTAEIIIIFFIYNISFAPY